MSVTAKDIRKALITREEIALIDLREEAEFALGHPLFAAQIPLRRINAEAPWRIPRKDTRIVVYDNGEDLTEAALVHLRALGFTHVEKLAGGLSGWKSAGYELFEDVNSYSKAFGELVEHRRHTPSLPAQDVQALIEEKADIAILDARRFDEYATMSIPGGISSPGAELVLRARAAAPDPDTTIIVNCAGRTRSIIGAQSLVNAGLPNRIYALRNGTIGWTLAGQGLETGQQRRAALPDAPLVEEAREKAREVAYRAGVKRITPEELDHLRADNTRTLYQYDVRLPEDYAAGHIPGFRNAQGGQLVQETDHFAPVRGARIVLADDLGPRADMTASWLAQLGWEVYVLEGGAHSETGPDAAPAPRGVEGRYKRPYEGTDNAQAAMQAYLDWEYGLVAQLERDGTHGFFVI
ncbi:MULTISPECIES: rhodanese-like domain-containing protein [unclassified Novosphingobium]|uniref:rhodanese-like domain-containing protein n=1 Tax=unclassified Novosphingobium TaxID=2644732 RepID=UPI000869887F|nr:MULTISPECIES: rhodanese-like domain-containing protein [unclassified Novosphingobium]MDR6708695.1 rhodanese-related sulfurtransferase [Novosphingobium sp. 1748]ODU81958.1 MAG: thiosulfate sulfurtransferase [Novosphingobium sp. SCN 63-17]OJX96682.1 MAG: thiosulfate sulfurtransferase [Novosphingobium sp. 63-713]